MSVAAQAASPAWFAARELLAGLVWIGIAAPSGILYALFLQHGVGQNLGWVGGATVVMVPVFVIAVGIAMWLPAFLVARSRRGARLGLQAPLLAAASASIACLVFGGPPSFAISSGATPMLAWLVIALAATAAFLHDRLSHAWLAGRNDIA